MNKKKSSDFDNTTYVHNSSKVRTSNNAPNIQWDKYDVVEGHLAKKRI